MLKNLTKFLAILAISVTLAASTPLADETTAENSLADQTPVDDTETLHIMTDPIFRISFSVAGHWNENFGDSNSAAFKMLRDELDAELREIIKADSHAELPTGTFRLMSILPSSESSFLYLTVYMEAQNEEVASEWKDAIESQILLNSKLKLKETGAVLHNNDLNLTRVNFEEEFQCENGEKISAKK